MAELIPVPHPLLRGDDAVRTAFEDLLSHAGRRIADSTGSDREALRRALATPGEGLWRILVVAALNETSSADLREPS